VQPLQQAVALDSSYAEPHYLLGRIYQKLGENGLAKSEVERFKEIEKNQEKPATTGSDALPK